MVTIHHPGDRATIILHHICSPSGIADRIISRCTHTIESTISNSRRITQEGNTSQADAIIEYQCSNAGDAIGDSDAGQTTAIVECKIANTGHTIQDGNVSQAGTVPERPCTNAGNAPGDGDAGQAGAVIERIISDAGGTVRNSDASQTFACIERPCANSGNTIRDSNTGQAVAAIERIITNAGNTLLDNNRQNTGPITTPRHRCIVIHCSVAGNRQFSSFGIEFPIYILTAGATNVTANGALVIFVPIVPSHFTLSSTTDGTSLRRKASCFLPCVDALRLPCDRSTIILHHATCPGRIVFRIIGSCLDIVKSIISNYGGITTKYQLFYIITSKERCRFEGCNTFRNENLGQTSALIDCARRNGGNTVRNGIRARKLAGCSNQRRFCFIKKHTVFIAAIVCIASIHPYSGQIGAPGKRIFSNIGDAGRNGDASQFITLRKCALSDTNNTIRDSDTGQTVTAKKCIDANAGNAIRNSYTGQAAAVRERSFFNAGNTVGDGNTGQATVVERILTDAGDAVWNRDAGQATAVIERILTDAGDAVWDRDAGQATAVSERILTDAGDAVWNGDADQARTSESSTKAGDAVRDGDA